MGMFTVYCIFCGGPPEVPPELRDDYDPEEGMQVLPVVEAAKKTRLAWLNTCVAISEDGVVRNAEGKIRLFHYDSYGGMGEFTVSGMNWGQDVNSPCALLAHAQCARLYMTLYPNDSALLWSKLSHLVNYHEGVVLSIDYGPTSNTWGQFYELPLYPEPGSDEHETVGYELFDPYGQEVLKQLQEVVAPETPPARPVSPFPLLPSGDLALLIAKHLSAKDVCALSATCTRARSLCNQPSLWRVLARRAIRFRHPIMKRVPLHCFRQLVTEHPHFVHNARRVLNIMYKIHELVADPANKNPICEKCREVFKECGVNNLPANHVCGACGKTFCNVACERNFWYKDASEDMHFAKFSHPWRRHPCWHALE